MHSLTSFDKCIPVTTTTVKIWNISITSKKFPYILKQSASTITHQCWPQATTVFCFCHCTLLLPGELHINGIICIIIFFRLLK